MSTEELDKIVKETIRQGIEGNNGLEADPFNLWQLANNCSPRSIDRLIPILTYEERIKSHPVTGPYADFIIEHCVTAKIKRYNELVATFNRELAKIKRTGNWQRAKELGVEAFKLLEKEPE